MSYNILAIVPGHNGSVCLLVDGEIALYIEEERLSKQKYDANPYLGIIEVLTHYHVHELILGGTDINQYPVMTWTGTDPFTTLVKKYYPDVKVTNLCNLHHLGHAAGAFYNSNFDKALAIVVDGAGSLVSQEFNEGEEPFTVEGYETETVMLCEYPATFELLYRNLGSNWLNFPFDIDTDVVAVSTTCNIVKCYEAVTAHLGFSYIEAGKVMGLASYGKPDVNIPNLFLNGKGDKNTFIPKYPAGGYVDFKRNPYLKQQRDPVIWHHNDPKSITDNEKNLAYAIQQQTQQLVGNLIEKYVNLTGITNVVLAGGYALNCTANYYYKQRFPHINLYVDPVAHDGGTAIGLSKIAWFNYCQSIGKPINKIPLNTLYLGKDRNSEDFPTPVDFIEKEVTPADVAKLIADRKIISIFNGSSEAGPRALGNRSIVYDPRDPNGKSKVNEIKGREWFRPFAGTILAEKASEWFDMAGMIESPYMMYAVDVLPEKTVLIPCITHVDNTCRIQTVTKEQNKYFYELIEEFEKQTGVPIIFNTSFNLAGFPLVETFENAIDTLRCSELMYLYIPSKNKLLIKL